ncbi:MAG: family transporter protein [Verrucomicrobiales bacterium]|nr:family transporter protein [Verrucomicrobiales bacterium]
MTFLPIVERELRVAARNWKTYWGRMALVFITGIFCAAMLYLQSRVGSRLIASHLVFFSLAQILSFFAMFSGLASADAISLEKREGTLGLLFLTNLKGYDIMLGKLSATSLLSFYQLLATFPVLAIPLLLGGVTALEFFQTTLALVNVLFYSHALALLVSTQYKDAKKAAGAVSFLVCGIVFILPLLRYVPSQIPGSTLLRSLALLSPRGAFANAQSVGILTPTAIVPSSFWLPLMVSHLTAWGFLGLGSWILPHCWQEKGVGASRGSWRAWWGQLRYGNTQFRVALRRQLLDVNPFLWLVSRERFHQITLRIGVGIVSLILLGVTLMIHSGKFEPGKPELFIASICFAVILKGTASSEASRHFNRLRRSSELEMILATTPLSVEEILWGQWLAIRRIVLKPLIYVFIVNALLLGVGLMQPPETYFGQSGRMVFAIAMFLVNGMLLFDLWAIGWTGMWEGMSAKRPGQGSGESFVKIQLLPSLIFGFFFLRVGVNQMNFYLAAFVWLVISIANGVFWAKWCRYKLVQEFRSRALLYSDERMTWLGHLGRLVGHWTRDRALAKTDSRR